MDAGSHCNVRRCCSEEDERTRHASHLQPGTHLRDVLEADCMRKAAPRCILQWEAWPEAQNQSRTPLRAPKHTQYPNPPPFLFFSVTPLCRGLVMKAADPRGCGNNSQQRSLGITLSESFDRTNVRRLSGSPCKSLMGLEDMLRVSRLVQASSPSTTEMAACACVTAARITGGTCVIPRIYGHGDCWSLCPIRHVLAPCRKSARVQDPSSLPGQSPMMWKRRTEHDDE